MASHAQILAPLFHEMKNHVCRIVKMVYYYCFEFFIWAIFKDEYKDTADNKCKLCKDSIAGCKTCSYISTTLTCSACLSGYYLANDNSNFIFKSNDAFSLCSFLRYKLFEQGWVIMRHILQ